MQPRKDHLLAMTLLLTSSFALASAQTTPAGGATPPSPFQVETGSSAATALIARTTTFCTTTCMYG